MNLQIASDFAELSKGDEDSLTTPEGGDVAATRSGCSMSAIFWSALVATYIAWSAYLDFEVMRETERKNDVLL
jgi:hypothetical protein